MIEFVYELARSTAKGRSLRGGNEMVSSNDRLCPHVKAELTAYLRALSAELASEQIKDTEHVPYSMENPCHMTIIISPPTRRRMDTPNWYPTVKALVDGLTDAGVFVDDNDKVIRSYLFLGGAVTKTKKYAIRLIIKNEKEVGKWLT